MKQATEPRTEPPQEPPVHYAMVEFGYSVIDGVCEPVDPPTRDRMVRAAEKDWQREQMWRVQP